MQRTILYATVACAALLGGYCLLRGRGHEAPPPETPMVTTEPDHGNAESGTPPPPSRATTQAQPMDASRPTARAVTDAALSPPRSSAPVEASPPPRPPSLVEAIPPVPPQRPPAPGAKTVPTPPRSEPDLAVPVPAATGAPASVPTDLAWLARADLPIVSATLSLTDPQRIELERLVLDLQARPSEDRTAASEWESEWNGRVLALLSPEQRELLGRAEGALRSTQRPLDAPAASPSGGR